LAILTPFCVGTLLRLPEHYSDCRNTVFQLSGREA
jgi:hypothetical protein